MRRAMALTDYPEFYCKMPVVAQGVRAADHHASAVLHHARSGFSVAYYLLLRLSAEIELQAVCLCLCLCLNAIQEHASYENS